MNMKREPLDKGQKVDAAEIAAILRGVPPSAELLCRMAANAYIAGIKAGAAMRGVQQTDGSRPTAVRQGV